MKLIQEWKKVFETDLDYVSSDLKDVLHFPCVVILEGPLGAGKTTFVKSYAADSYASSPTYSLVNEYGQILHADLYRIEEEVDLLDLELDLYADDIEVFFIEWGKNYKDSLQKILANELTFYLLEVEILPEKEGKKSMRNFRLQEYTNKVSDPD